MRSLKSNFLYQLLVSFLFTAAPLIVFPYVSRVLGPDNIGKINFIDYAVQFFIVLSSFGIPFYGVREIAKTRNDKQKLSKLVSELFVIHVMMTILSLMLFTALVILWPDKFKEKELVLIAFVNIATSAVAFEWIIHGLEDFAFLARRSFVVKLASLIAVFILIQNTSDYLTYYYLLMGSNLFLLAIDITYVLRKKIYYSRGLNLRKHLRPLSVFFLTTVTLSVYTFFDTVILGLVTSGTLAVGFYTTSIKVIRLSHNFISDLGGVLLPRVSYLVDAGHHDEVNRIINKSFSYVMTITLPLGTFFLLAADEIIHVLAGKAFAGAIPVLQILAPLPLIIGIGNIFFMQVLLPYGKEKILLTGVLIGCAVSVASNLVLSPVYEEKGAALSCLLAEIITTSYLGFFAVAQLRFQFAVKLLLGIVLSCLVFYPLIHVTRYFLQGDLVILLVSGILCVGVYGLLQLVVFRNPIAADVKSFVLDKLGTKIKPNRP